MLCKKLSLLVLAFSVAIADRYSTRILFLEGNTWRLPPVSTTALSLISSPLTDMMCPTSASLPAAAAKHQAGQSGDQSKASVNPSQMQRSLCLSVSLSPSLDLSASVSLSLWQPWSIHLAQTMRSLNTRAKHHTHTHYAHASRAVHSDPKPGTVCKCSASEKTTHTPASVIHEGFRALQPKAPPCSVRRCCGCLVLCVSSAWQRLTKHAPTLICDAGVTGPGSTRACVA